MSRLHALFLATVASIAFAPSLALAQVTAAPADAVPADAAEEGGDEIVVLGFGQARQVQTITNDDFSRLTPGTSPIKAVSKLPGVNFQSADAFGAYEWSSRISLRGFNQNQLGFTLDGVPLGDMSYGTHNGLHISRAIISENTGTVTVAQGAGALGVASTSNLGGTLQFMSVDPSDTFDLVASGTYGSDETFRAFARVESGDLTGNGLKGYLSYGFLKTDKWKGYGEQRQHQVNAKVVQELGDGSISGFFNFSDRRENDYQDMTAEMIQRLGYNWDNISDDFPTAYAVAAIAQNQAWLKALTDAGTAFPQTPQPYPQYGFTFPAPIASLDDAYFDAAGLRKDYLSGVTLDAPLTENVRFTITGYYHHNIGQGLWVTPYTPTPGGAPLSVRSTDYNMKRAGVLPKLTITTGINELQIGGWYESNSFRQKRRFFGLEDSQTFSRDILEFQKDPFFTQWDFKFDTQTLQYFVSDKVDLGDLTISGGWKGYRVRNKANPIVQSSLPSGEIEAKDWFLPQIGAVYSLGDIELFATYTENMRAFSSAAVDLSPFATTQAGFDSIRDELKPEKSSTYEIGGRFRSGMIQGSLAGYYVDFSDRLLLFSTGSPILGTTSTLQNVGNVRNYGVEATLLVKPLPAFSLFASYAYNKSEYRDDVFAADGSIFAATKGKTVVDSPEHMLKGEIVYDDGQFMARIGADYMSKRYFNYLNTESVPSRVLMDAAIGYTFKDMGFLDGFGIEGSVTNLTDKKYVSTVGSGGYQVDPGRQTLLTGAPRQFFVTVRRGF